MGEPMDRYTEPPWMERVVEWFERPPGEAWVGEARLEGASLPDLQRLWQQLSDEPMLECFEVTEAQREAVERCSGIEIVLQRFIYYIPAYTTDWDAMLLDGGYHIPAAHLE